MSTLAIDARGVDKSFGRFQALDSLDLTVRTGQVAGFLGPNGAGKSTTIRVLLGLLKADSGDVRLLGGDPWKEAVALHRRLAYVPGDVSLWPNLTGGEAIDLLGRLRGGLDARRRRTFLERFELDPAKKARTYSKGNRQKVALVAALASTAELLILDEPTSGLDPLMETVFTESVREVKEEGRTVLLSSHILSEVEKLCDTVTIIRRGRTVESGTLDELRHLTRSTVRAEVEGDPRALADAPGVHDLTIDEGRVSFAVDHEHMGAVMSRVTSLGVRSLVSNPPSLEELFMRHYGDDLVSLDGHAKGGTDS
ncbi:ATP-binding cassette domain-containing protein [Nocardiopsis alba]|uniref:ATP-binding cassette domain-containing protein n=1 Tax=Nocardiopsis alba TaxID=53437 RepID=A0A7K2IPL2_9ACTN|nr:ABC transporter ATP-binding protein [Nocardiopsis alba]MYR31919.1 ATP-binding cassette domain-containing protein [Nocardiopsis alba]